MRLFGEHERLDERISHYLKAKDPYELYGKVIDRWEEDYGKDLVKASMPLIWAARRGLSETELLDILGKDGEPLPRAEWSPLFLAARGSLISRAGLLNFSHDFLRNAVRDTYIPIEDNQISTHIQLADYLERQEANPRTIDELPWQFAQGHAWQRLRDLLADPPFFTSSWNLNRFDVKTYWTLLEGAGMSMTETYKPVIDIPEDFPVKDYVWRIAKLLGDTGHLHEAFSLRQFLVAYYRNKRDTNSLSASLGSQALILKDWGQLDEAMALYKEEERICRELGDKEGLSNSLGNQALILDDRGQLDEAMALLKEQECICRELGNKGGLSNSFNNQALILKDWGQLDEAMALYKEDERICRELGNKDGLSDSLCNQGNILYIRGQLDEAMALHKEVERICRGLGNKDGLSNSLGNQALILKDWGQLDEAMALHKEQERICRELENKDGLSISLNNQAVILQAWRQLDEAMALLKEEERICRELGMPEGIALSLANQAILSVFSLFRPLTGVFLAIRGYRIARTYGPRFLKGRLILTIFITLFASPFILLLRVFRIIKNLQQKNNKHKGEMS